ncbi:MAG: AmmeMemoRadiSam system protein B [Deltaproteobacteria bacterium]|nr:MAG: AmmeMemoRadiSam system protein B [Deltaproteobacteria bacterium]TMQ08922.1 MAG: AmmeMemoRadiSam system protein B [Deltaproteobacteria bacterium]
METVRRPAVAGSFYPASADALGRMVDQLVAAVPRGPAPKALIVPHAGYVYSGSIAASGFARIAGAPISRVVLVGPAHRKLVEGLAWPGAAQLRTPLGDIAVDLDALRQIGAPADAAAHAREHALEVELPFLQRLAPGATVVPLIGSSASPETVGRTLEALWGGPETLIVISSDLSHYLPYAEGRERDQRTCARIVALDPAIDPDDACGSIGINGLTWVARRKQLRAELIDLRSSGDTAGPLDDVVGYAAIAFYEAA